MEQKRPSKDQEQCHVHPKSKKKIVLITGNNGVEVRAFSEVLVRSNEANEAVDTTAVTYRLKYGKKSYAILDHF